MADTNNFKIWSQNVLPIVFDDYVSQKDMFVKMVRYINGLIGDMQTVYNDFTQLDTSTIGDLTDLHTTAKTSVVAAINEVEDDVENLKTDLSELESQLNQLGLSVVDGAINITFEEVVA